MNTSANLAAGRLQLILAAALFSTGGLAIKAISMNHWQVACLRSAFAAATILLLLPEARTRWKAAVWGPALAYAAMLILFVTSTKLTTSANAIYLQATAPLYLVFLGPLLLKEPTRREDWWTLLVLGAGMSLFFLGEPVAQSTAPQPALGNLLAAASGFTWALVLVSLRAWGRRDPAGNLGMQVVVLGNLLVTALCAPFALPLDAATSAGAATSPGAATLWDTAALLDWTLLAYLGIFQIALAYLAMTRGMRQVPALEASMILLLEPVLNPIWTWLALGEQPGSYAVVGGVLILLGTLARFYFSSRRAALPV
ncbi:MAG: EamA family transporter [Bryobacterales bacterium]|jgi:drug/metabolite transporter (DMT)-like permease|nr:EamA family transporter [Bryobacterales bacterium]